MKTIYDLNPFARSYVQALYFTEEGTGDGIESDSELSESALARIEADCAEFEAKYGEIIDSAECTRGSGEYTQREQAAHDFWLTRNGHGAGFWDGDWSEPHAKQLTDAAKSFGECWAYLGDDGLIYIQ